MDYRKQIKIRPEQLETEWMDQPANYLEAWEMYTDAVAIRDKRKQRLEIIYSELDEKIRKHWKKLGFETKPSEPAIKEWIIRQKKHIKAERKLISANKQVNLTNGIRKAFEQKKDGLGNMVSMKISGYYSEPKTVQEKRERAERKRKRNKSRKKLERKKT